MPNEWGILTREPWTASTAYVLPSGSLLGDGFRLALGDLVPEFLGFVGCRSCEKPQDPPSFTCQYSSTTSNVVTSAISPTNRWLIISQFPSTLESDKLTRNLRLVFSELMHI